MRERKCEQESLKNPLAVLSVSRLALAESEEAQLASTIKEETVHIRSRKEITQYLSRKTVRSPETVGS